MPPSHCFESPFNGDFNTSMRIILSLLSIHQIEVQPVESATIYYLNSTSETITTGQTKYYGLAFLAYCLSKHGTKEERATMCFTIRPPMIVEAILYYGLHLWGDHRRAHPLIEPFRAALQGAEGISIALTCEPQH